MINGIYHLKDEVNCIFQSSYQLKNEVRVTSKGHIKMTYVENKLYKPSALSLLLFFNLILTVQL